MLHPPAPSRFPKWATLTLGGIFSFIFLGSSIMIVQLLKAPEASAAGALAAAPVVAAPAAPVEAPAVAAADEPAAAPVAEAPRARAHGKHHVKVAKKAVVSSAKARVILARHDSSANKKKRDAIDKLLGL